MVLHMKDDIFSFYLFIFRQFFYNSKFIKFPFRLFTRNLSRTFSSRMNLKTILFSQNLYQILSPKLS